MGQSTKTMKPRDAGGSKAPAQSGQSTGSNKAMNRPAAKPAGGDYMKKSGGKMSY